MVRLKSGSSFCLQKNPKINDSQSWTTVPAGNIWQCVETLWVVITGGEGRGLTGIKWAKAGQTPEQPIMRRPVSSPWQETLQPKREGSRAGERPETPCPRGNGTPATPGSRSAARRTDVSLTQRAELLGNRQRFNVWSISEHSLWAPTSGCS